MPLGVIDFATPIVAIYLVVIRASCPYDILPVLIRRCCVPIVSGIYPVSAVSYFLVILSVYRYYITHGMYCQVCWSYPAVVVSVDLLLSHPYSL